MAATRLIALHKIKSMPLADCIKARVDYVSNPEKTEKGELITGYACDPKTVREEFLLSWSNYNHKVGNKGQGNVIAYQIRQSFKPGEITAEEANRIGYETAMRFTKGEHAFIVATHTDKKHIHNHVLFNAINLSCDKKFKNFLRSGIALGRLSNLICLENGLSVIAEAPFHSKDAYIRYPNEKTFRDDIREAINIALSKKPRTFDEFLLELTSQGYAIKRGKHTAVKGKEQKRFIRFRSLGKGYTEDELRKKIEGVVKGVVQDKEAVPYYRQESFDLLLNLQDIIAKGKGPGYELWAKKFNLKNVMKAILFFQEQGLRTYDELEKRAGGSADRFDELASEIKSYEKRMKEISSLRQNIIDYSKTKDIYTQYRKTGYSKYFFAEHKDDIMLHKSAKDSFNKYPGKLPSVQSLTEEYGQLLSKKKAAYAEYRQVRKDMQLYQTAKYDIDRILGIVPVTEKKKTIELSR